MGGVATERGVVMGWGRGYRRGRGHVERGVVTEGTWLWGRGSGVGGVVTERGVVMGTGAWSQKGRGYGMWAWLYEGAWL